MGTCPQYCECVGYATFYVGSLMGTCPLYCECVGYAAVCAGGNTSEFIRTVIYLQCNLTAGRYFPLIMLICLIIC